MRSRPIYSILQITGKKMRHGLVSRLILNAMQIMKLNLFPHGHYAVIFCREDFAHSTVVSSYYVTCNAIFSFKKMNNNIGFITYKAIPSHLAKP